MLRRLRDYLCGWRCVEVKKDDLAAAFDLIYKKELSFSSEQRGSDGSVSFRMHERDCRKFMAFAGSAGISYEVSEPLGLPVTLRFIRRRPMIPLGIAMLILWLMYSENLVWDIRVSGNTKTSDREIVDKLDGLGFGIGTYYPEVNFNQLHADYVAGQDDIAWLSVYMHGTVAEVQVKEKYIDDRIRPGENTYANIVATEAGVVHSVAVYEGQAAVEIGDIVMPGQVLISGVVEMKDGSTRYEYAQGEVICSTADSARVEIASEREEKRYTGAEKTKKTVKIFKKTINLFAKGGIEYATCDKIDMMEQLCPFGLIPLPVWISTTVYREYEKVSVAVSPEIAVEYGLKELHRLIREKTAGGQLISKEIKTAYENGIYRIDCLMYLLKDVGRTVEFTATDGEA